MASEALSDKRLAVIVKIAKNAAPRRLGRTAMMKLLYLLQTVRGLPLQYRFRLYTYGPFDVDVLDDLRYAETVGGVTQDYVSLDQGYAYEIAPGEESDKIISRVESFIESYSDDFNWVISNFAARTAVDLEMVSTLVFVDRAAAARSEIQDIDALSEKVVGIKPHLSRSVVQRETVLLTDLGLLRSVAQTARRDDASRPMLQ